MMVDRVARIPRIRELPSCGERNVRPTIQRTKACALPEELDSNFRWNDAPA